ncbi:MAG: cysteine--tRNA ligase, partial [Candidatus Woesearchaeota archaeon]
DVDDKTISRSRQEGVTLKQLTTKYANAFFEELALLNIKPATVYPRATEHIPEMVAMIKALMAAGLAYTASDNCIYYSISKFKDYGKLAGIRMEKLRPGASGRVVRDEYEKERVEDFALWKAWRPEDGDVFWETELGKGRPGWHIECSAMSTKYLGCPFDIHSGGVDLIFPHHQNEIAQSEGAGCKKFVNYWLHNEWLLVEGKKMSKSLGNFYTLRDLLAKGYDPKAIRYILLATHYRQKLNFTFKGLEAAERSLQRIWDFVARLDSQPLSVKKPAAIDGIISRTKAAFEAAMDDDLDISKALAAIYALITKTNKLIDDQRLAREDCQKIKKFLITIDSILGILIPPPQDELAPELKALIEKREAARAAGDWAKADAIRQELAQKGILLEDTPQGVRWKKVKALS